MENRQIQLFVPGRLCLFGEHSDWAGMYRSVNSQLEKGEAIVTGIEQGIYANAVPSEKFIVTSPLELYQGEHLECEMDSEKLLDVAQQGGFFSYVAGVASYINDNYSVGGVTITVTKMDLPIKSGLSSSAAICVLVARAFNQLYGLKMNVQGEMQAAFRGEQRTPSRCGRLDQACAYGVKPVCMEFDGVEIRSRVLRVGTTFHWVIANLMSHKDTIKILADLNKAYPFAESEQDRLVQEALGRDNLAMNRKVIDALQKGDAPALGALMDASQKNFDRKVAPACTELTAPVLHSVLADPQIRQWIYGAKGVGSQGDGTVQFLARSSEDADRLQHYLESVLGMPSFRLTLKPGQTVKRAIIPLAGFGTRVFPATKSIKKCFLPILDRDGILKPALLIMLEDLLDAGIEEIALVIGEEDREEFEKFFDPISPEHFEKLPDDKKEYERKIEEIRSHLTFIIQKERLGFGHAVWLARSFTQNEPVLLMLGDFLYKAGRNRKGGSIIRDGNGAAEEGGGGFDHGVDQRHMRTGQSTGRSASAMDHIEDGTEMNRTQSGAGQEKGSSEDAEVLEVERERVDESEPVNCCRQVIDAFKECGKTLVSIHEVPLSKVVHYGILHGTWTSSSDDGDRTDPLAERMMDIDAMVEKPTDDYAKQYLGVMNSRKQRKYYATFGQYVLTPAVFEELEREIKAHDFGEGSGGAADAGDSDAQKEYGLTQALQEVLKTEGICGFVPDGTSYDIGLPEEYRRTMMEFCQ